MSELLQLCYNHPVFAVLGMNKCPSDTVVCATHLLAVPNVTGLDSGPTMLTALLVQQLYGLPITTLEKATSQAHVHPGFNVSDPLIITLVMNSVLTSSTGLSHPYSHPCFSVTYILLLWCPPSFPTLSQLGEEDLAT